MSTRSIPVEKGLKRPGSGECRECGRRWAYRNLTQLINHRPRPWVGKYPHTSPMRKEERCLGSGKRPAPGSHRPAQGPRKTREPRHGDPSDYMIGRCSCRKCSKAIAREKKITAEFRALWDSGRGLPWKVFLERYEHTRRR